jgi:hypothetical protein
MAWMAERRKPAVTRWMRMVLEERMQTLSLYHPVGLCCEAAECTDLRVSLARVRSHLQRENN